MEQEQEWNYRTKTKLKNDVKKIRKDVGAETEQHKYIKFILWMRYFQLFKIINNRY